MKLVISYKFGTSTQFRSEFNVNWSEFATKLPNAMFFQHYESFGIFEVVNAFQEGDESSKELRSVIGTPVDEDHLEKG